MNPSILSSILETARTVVVGLAFVGSVPDIGATVSPAITAREMAWHHMAPTSSPATTTDKSWQLSTQVRRARKELEVAKRLLDVLTPLEPEPWILEYVRSLQDVLDRAHRSMDESHEKLAQFTPVLELNLQTARKNLLDEVPKASIWVSLARAISPNERYPVPRRFVVQARKTEQAFPLDAIKTGAWMRTWNQG